MSVARILEVVQGNASVESERREERKKPEWKEIRSTTKQINENFSVNFKLEQSGPYFRFSIVNRDGRPTGIKAKGADFDLVADIVMGELRSAVTTVIDIDAEFAQKQAERETKRNGGGFRPQQVRSTGKTERDRAKKGIKKQA